MKVTHLDAEFGIFLSLLAAAGDPQTPFGARLTLGVVSLLDGVRLLGVFAACLDGVFALVLGSIDRRGDVLSNNSVVEMTLFNDFGDIKEDNLVLGSDFDDGIGVELVTSIANLSSVLLSSPGGEGSLVCRDPLDDFRRWEYGDPTLLAFLSRFGDKCSCSMVVDELIGDNGGDSGIISLPSPLV